LALLNQNVPGVLHDFSGFFSDRRLTINSKKERRS